MDWSQADLSERTGISATSIGSIENNQSTPRASTLSTIRKAFEDSGIEFLGLDGVRMKSEHLIKLSGSEGFSDFLDDVYFTAIANGTAEAPCKVYLSNVVHENWTKWMGEEKWKNHAQRMTKDKAVMDVRIIVKEGDWNFPASDYAEYKWFPEEVFNDKSFYSYHNKLAFLNFNDDDVEIIIIRHADFAEGYRNLFEMAWKHGAIDPHQFDSVKVDKR